jgi:hypothetical protein
MLTPNSPTLLQGTSQDGVESGFHFDYIRRRDEIEGVGGTSGVFRQVVSQIHFVFFLQCIMKLDGHSRLVIHCHWEGIFNIEYEQVLHSLLGHRL